jgi:uncharacterized membrane protein (UPF0127 family)
MWAGISLSFYSMRAAGLVVLAIVLAACGSGPAGVEELNTRIVTLPGDRKIRAEVVTTPEDMARGLMFRDSLAPDRGMLFIHQQPGNYPYWMYQCRISLDIIWIDTERRIVEISAGTPPCKTSADQCPNYGGHERAQFVLELAGGMTAKYGVKVGDRIDF